jgi:SpoVK/Ycf46/Vps4 family AAA+-type ATPase
VFFCDLPESPEREEIFAIHLKSNKADPGAFDLARLVRATEGWTAAEIAQAVSTARVEALGEKRAFTTRDILDYAATSCHCRARASRSSASAIGPGPRHAASAKRAGHAGDK